MKKVANKEKLEIYRSLLPYGAQKEIATKLGVSVQAVCNYLKGRQGSERIETAILEKIAEVKEARQRLLKRAGLENANI